MAKYNKEVKRIIFECISKGDTQKEAGFKAGIGENTFNRWTHEKEEFRELVEKAKAKYRETLRIKLETALYKKATGYVEEEVETEYRSDKDGNPQIKYKRVKQKHFSPDTGALVFALSNLAPEKWKNRQQVQNEDITGKPKDEPQEYHFEGVPDDVLFNIADAMQDSRAEQERKLKGVGNGKESGTESE